MLELFEAARVVSTRFELEFPACVEGETASVEVLNLIVE